MKNKIITAIVSSVVLILIVATPIFGFTITGAKYLTTINLYNTGATSTGNVIPLALSIPDMVSRDLTAADALDMVLIDSSGSNVPFEPYATNTTCMLYVDTINNNSQRFDYLYSKGGTGGNLVQFPNGTGWTISDDITPEGNDFTWHLGNVYLISDIGASKILYSHYDTVNGGIKVYGSNTTADNVTATIYVPPVYVSSNTSGTGTSTSISVTKPSGVASGGLLIISAIARPTTAYDSVTISNPAGYTTLFNDTAFYSGAGGTSYSGGGWWKVTTGAESNPISITVSENAYYCYQAFYFAPGTYSGNPAISARGSGTGSNPNPPNLSSGFGTVSTRWLALEMGTETAGTAPSGYGGLKETAGVPYMATAWKYSTASSEDPGTYGASVTGWQSYTIGLRLTTQSTSISLAGISGHYNDLSFSLSGGTFRLSTDGGTTSVAYAGSIPNSTSNITLATNTACLYIGSANFTQGGILRNKYTYEYPSSMSSVLTNGTGTATGSPKTLALGLNTITVTGAGNFTIANSYGWKAVAVSSGGGVTVTSGPVSCPSASTRGATTTTTIAVTGTGTFRIFVYRVFTDQSVNTNDAVISFRTAATNANITASIVSQDSLAVSSFPAGGDTLAWSMINAAEKARLKIAPSGLFGESGTNFPGGAQAAKNAQSSGETLEFWLGLLAAGTSVLAGILVFSKSHKPEKGARGSKFLMCATIEGCLIIWYTIGRAVGTENGVIPGWWLIPFGIVFIFLLLIKNPYNLFN